LPKREDGGDVWHEAAELMGLLYPTEVDVVVESVAPLLLGTDQVYVPQSDDDARIALNLCQTTPPVLEAVASGSHRGRQAAPSGYRPTPVGRCLAVAMLMQSARDARRRGVADDDGKGVACDKKQRLDRLSDWGGEEPEPWTPEAWRRWREEGDDRHTYAQRSRVAATSRYHAGRFWEHSRR
jgi:hypothetical protein